MMFEIGLGVLLLGFLLSIGGGIMFLVRGFQASPWWGVGILLLAPLIGLFFFFTNFKKAWNPAFMHILGTIMIPASVFFAPQDPEFNTKMVGYFPFMEGQEIDTELFPSFAEAVELAKGIKLDDLKTMVNDVTGEQIGEGDSEEEGADTDTVAMEDGSGKKFKLPVLSFDPSEPLDPDQVEVRVSKSNDDRHSTSSAAPLTLEPPAVSLSKKLVGLPETAVTEELGKPLGVGSKKGQVYWMYVDCIVTFDNGRRVAAVDFDGAN